MWTVNGGFQVVVVGRGRTYWEAQQDAQRQVATILAGQALGEALAPVVAALVTLLFVTSWWAAGSVIACLIRPWR
jgi:hypothetical protein